MFTDTYSIDFVRLSIEIVCFCLLLVLSGFFSSSETSMFSLKPTQLEGMRRSKKPGYQLIEKMLAEPRRLIVTILIGNELVNITASALSAAIIIRLFGADNSYLNLLIVTPMLLIFGEITPKTFAFKNSVAFALFEAPLIQKFAQFVTPVRIAIRFVSDSITTLIVGKERVAGSLVTQDMVLTLTREAVGDGVLQINEAHYINQVFKFGEARVEDVMTPRSNVQFISHDSTPAEVVARIKTSGHSKLPVYKDGYDNVTGVLFGRDLLSGNMKKLLGKTGFKSILRDTYFIPGSRQVIDLFHHFRSQRISMAIVLDEYGGITGLVTMDDLLRCIFGDLPSVASSQKTAHVRKKNKPPQSIDAFMPVLEFNKLYNCQLPTTISNTMNGLFMYHYGELPKKGTQIEVDNVLLSVLSMKGNRINQLKITSADKKSKGLRQSLFARKDAPELPVVLDVVPEAVADSSELSKSSVKQSLPVRTKPTPRKKNSDPVATKAKQKAQKSMVKTPKKIQKTKKIKNTEKSK